MPRRKMDEFEDYAVDEEKVRQAQKKLVDGLTATHLAQTFRALSDPARVRIVSALASGELCVCNIAAAVGLSDSAVAHQLRGLRESKLVEFRKEGGEAFYSLKSAHIAALFAEGLKHTGQA
jgi:DNA-binding transcriptional ArsR family regulator